MNRFGEYVLYEQLGTSERSSVHRATVACGEASARAVAIKRFPTSLFPTEEAATRHAADVARAAQLHHPNIGAVYRVGRLGDTTYVEMEHIVGIPLEELLHDIRTDGPPPIDVAVSLIAELGRALEVAHGRNVVHGDINPGHLLIDTTGCLKVLGFGMAQLEKPLTQRCYAAPETLGGAPADTRGDLYALGVVAYELLTGQPLFDEHMEPQLRSYLGSCIPPPSSCNPDCPPELDAAILRALAISPDERWATARDLCEAMSPFGGPAPDRVREWLDQKNFPWWPAASSRASLPPGMPAPPRRAARGSGRLPSPAETTPNPERDESLHDAETVIRPPTTPGRRELRLPLRAPSEPYLAIETGDSAPPWIEEDASALVFDEELVTAIESSAEVIHEPSSALVTGSHPTSQLAPGPWPRRDSRALPRYVELCLAFVAGAIAMYLLIAWLG